jgi:hypothetical protein
MVKNVSSSVCNAATYVGNRPASTLDIVGPDKRTLREKYIIGDPQACPAASAEEMKRRGFVGIYQREPVMTFRLPHSNMRVIKTW